MSCPFSLIPSDNWPGGTDVHKRPLFNFVSFRKTTINDIDVKGEGEKNKPNRNNEL